MCFDCFCFWFIAFWTRECDRQDRSAWKQNHAPWNAGAFQGGPQTPICHGKSLCDEIAERKSKHMKFLISMNLSAWSSELQPWYASRNEKVRHIFWKESCTKSRCFCENVPFIVDWNYLTVEGQKLCKVIDCTEWLPFFTFPVVSFWLSFYHRFCTNHSHSHDLIGINLLSKISFSNEKFWLFYWGFFDTVKVVINVFDNQKILFLNIFHLGMIPTAHVTFEVTIVYHHAHRSKKDTKGRWKQWEQFSHIEYSDKVQYKLTVA